MIQRIPEEIREFIASYCPSIQHLETLMLLHRNPNRSWSARDLAAELGILPSAAAAVLDELASHNFLDVKISNDLLFRFNPISSELELRASRCADFYVRQRVAIINLVG